MTPEKVAKFQQWLAERGQHKTLEEAKNLIEEAAKLQKRLRNTSMERLWEIADEAREEDKLNEKELEGLMELMYYAKTLEHH